jgi:hypothetical protein
MYLSNLNYIYPYSELYFFYAHTSMYQSRRLAAELRRVWEGIPEHEARAPSHLKRRIPHTCTAYRIPHTSGRKEEGTATERLAYFRFACRPLFGPGEFGRPCRDTEILILIYETLHSYSSGKTIDDKCLEF